jgi:acetyl esterase/lipase
VDYRGIEDQAMRSTFVIVAALVAWAATGQAAPAAEPAAKPLAVKVHRNVAYRSLEVGEVVPLGSLVDLYLPEDGKDFPTVVLAHGGAWVAGNKTLDRIPDVARCLARQGIGVVAANYRLAPWVKHPVQVQDVAAAVAWTHRHIAEYGGTPERIFLLGHSAGGHLVSLLATDDRYLRKVGLAREDVKGVVSVSGVYQLSDVSCTLVLDDWKTTVDIEAANPFALAFGKDLEVARRASPLTHVREKLPPFLVIYADNDLPTLGEMAVQFDAALRQKRCDVQLMKAANRSHLTVFTRAREADDPVARAVVEFVRKDRRAARD